MEIQRGGPGAPPMYVNQWQMQGQMAPACPTCWRAWGYAPTCQFCGQLQGAPPGVRLSSVGKRLAAHILDGILIFLTLGIGYFIWALVVFANGQTPGKQILGMRAVSLRTGRTASWGITFVREVIAKWLIGILAVFTLGIVYFWLLWDKSNQQLWDKIVDTVVVDAP